MLKLPIDNGNIDLSEYAKKSDIPSIVGLASETYVDSEIADLINSAPEELDTLGEIAEVVSTNKGAVETLKKDMVTEDYVQKQLGDYTSKDYFEEKMEELEESISTESMTDEDILKALGLA